MGGKIGLQGQFRARPSFARRASVVSCAARSFISVLFGVISSFSVILLVSPPSLPAKSRNALRYDTLTLSRTRRAKKRGGSREGRSMWEENVSLFPSRGSWSCSPPPSRSRRSFETLSQVHYRQETLPAARTWPLRHGQVRKWDKKRSNAYDNTRTTLKDLCARAEHFITRCILMPKELSSLNKSPREFLKPLETLSPSCIIYCTNT